LAHESTRINTNRKGEPGASEIQFGLYRSVRFLPAAVSPSTSLIRVHWCPFVGQLNRSGAAASATGAQAGESAAGRIGRFTTDSPMPVPPRGGEGKAVWEVNRQAVMKMNHIK
jgi:hypothetical protein